MAITRDEQRNAIGSRLILRTAEELWIRVSCLIQLAWLASMSWAVETKITLPLKPLHPLDRKELSSKKPSSPINTD